MFSAQQILVIYWVFQTNLQVIVFLAYMVIKNPQCVSWVGISICHLSWVGSLSAHGGKNSCVFFGKYSRISFLFSNSWEQQNPKGIRIVEKRTQDNQWIEKRVYFLCLGCLFCWNTKWKFYLGKLSELSCHKIILCKLLPVISHVAILIHL